MYCSKCGKKVPDGYEYCMYCGEKICEVHNHKKISNKRAIILISIILILISLACSWIFIFMPKFSYPKKYYSSLKEMWNKSYYELIDESNYKHFNYAGKQDEAGKYEVIGELINFTNNSRNSTVSYAFFGKYIYNENYSYDGVIPNNSKFDQTLELNMQYFAIKIEYNSDGTFTRYTKTDNNSYQQDLTGNYKRDGDIIVHSVYDGKSFSYLVKDNKLYENVYIKS